MLAPNLGGKCEYHMLWHVACKLTNWVDYLVRSMEEVLVGTLNG